MSGHGEKKRIPVFGAMTNYPSWVPPNSPKKKKRTSRMSAQQKKAQSD
jgi:hypothetical protein